ncbi:MAG TPA: hypothetical protein PLZ51_11955 [Aggregatilineales bacterium]|nr:hypothetical protein [Aggregatilineales bacterium]
MKILLLIKGRKQARNRKAYTRILCDWLGWSDDDNKDSGDGNGDEKVCQISMEIPQNHRQVYVL